MLEVVRAFVTRCEMIPAQTAMIAAVSGGPDSTCLVHVLRELNAPLVGIAHFNHGLRGAESDGDEKFVVSLSNKLGIPCFITRERNSGQGNLEQELRNRRRTFFRSLIDQGHATRVALGHTQDDQAETVLFRLLRGTGLNGLAGILPVTEEGIVRPLLGITRDQVLGYLKERGLAWREDSSNRSLQFARNRLRHELLPELKTKWNPRVSEHLAQLASLAYEEEQEWATQVAEAAPSCLVLHDRYAEVRLLPLRLQPVAVQRRLLRKAIRSVLGHLQALGYGHIERMLELANQPGGEGSLQPPGIQVRRSFDWLCISKKGFRPVLEPTEVTIPGVYPTGDSQLNLVQMGRAKTPPYDTLRVTVAREPLVLRGWRPGDRYSPLSGRGARNVREMFQDERIPSWRRPVWPILTTRDSGIVWTRGWGSATEFAAPAESPRAIRVWESKLA